MANEQWSIKRCIKKRQIGFFYCSKNIGKNVYLTGEDWKGSQNIGIFQNLPPIPVSDERSIYACLTHITRWFFVKDSIESHMLRLLSFEQAEETFFNQKPKRLKLASLLQWHPWLGFSCLILFISRKLANQDFLERNRINSSRKRVTSIFVSQMKPKLLKVLMCFSSR